MTVNLPCFRTLRVSLLASALAAAAPLASAATHAAVSPVFSLDLRTTLPSRLVNVSTRGLVRPGEALTPGFVMAGPGGKQLVIRAIGPSLTGFGVAGVLADLRLDVIRAGATSALMSNENWGGNPALAAAFGAVGAFALGATSLDAAVQGTFPVDAYTVRTVPSGAATAGIALTEVYDADARTAAARLINVSTLGYVGTGANVLTAGFVIAGDLPLTVLIRAVGPGLSIFGVGERLADPHVALFAGSPPLTLASNDNWGGTAALRSAFAGTGAFALADSSRDAALLVALGPGSYTAVVSGVGDLTGNALVEVYEVPAGALAGTAIDGRAAVRASTGGPGPQ